MSGYRSALRVALRTPAGPLSSPGFDQRSLALTIACSTQGSAPAQPLVCAAIALCHAKPTAVRAFISHS
jgi:hypothetical protein